jgi:DNA-directed RNA polymerase subunit RPC12/RpoP
LGFKEGGRMILQKCSKCKRQFRNRQELEQLEKVSKKNTCTCGSKLITNVTENSERKTWFGYINIKDAKKIDFMVLVEKDFYDDGSIEVRIPLLSLEFQTTDRGSLISRCDEYIEKYLMDAYGTGYDKENQFVTTAYCEEEKKIIRNTDVWWK